MRKFIEKSFIYAAYGLGVLAMLAAVAGQFLPDMQFVQEVLLTLGFSSTGITLAATTYVAGPDTYKDANGVTNHLKEDVSKRVTLIKPDDAPLDTLLRSVGRSETAENIKVFFEEATYTPDSDTVSSTYTADSDATAEVTMTNNTIWTKGTIARVPSIDGAATTDGKELLMRVDSVNASNGRPTFTALNTTSNYVPTLTAGISIYTLGEAHAELAAQATPITLYPDQSFNYCQRFMTQVEQSLVRKNTPAKSGWSYQDQIIHTMYKFRTKMEASHIFGEKTNVTSTEAGVPVYTAEGIYRNMSNTYTYPTTLTWATFVDWTKDLFAGNAGSTDRFLFGGKDLIASILKLDNISKQLSGKEVEVIAGVKLSKIETNFGTIYIKHHKQFDTQGLPKKGMFVDMTNVVKRVYMPMTETVLELKKAGTKNVNAKLIEEISCLEKRYDDTHGKISPA